MKNTRKLLVALLLVFTLLMSMATIFASAADEGTVVYMKPTNNWIWQNSQRFAVYYFNDSGNGWVSMSDPDGDGVYEATIPAGYTTIIFCRMNASSSDNKWENRWNQTENLSVTTGKCYEITGHRDSGQKSAGKWVDYTPPVHSHTYERSEESVDATCHAGGKLVEVCSDPECGAKRETELKAGHAYVEGVCSACGFDINEAHTVYFNKPESWAEVAVHYWGDKGDGTTWPGTLITPVEGVYSIEIPAGYDHIIFNNNNKQSQTDDLTIPAEPQVYNLETKAWSDYHTHSWSDATCTEPQKCSCGATQGEALGHSFSNATCTEAAKCSCGATQGEALGHSFAEGICSVCGAEDPEYVAPEQPGETKPIVNITDLAVGTTAGGELIAGTGISASAGLAIDANNKSIDGFDFTKRLKLGGTMKVEDGVVKAGIEVVTNGPAKIVLYAISSSSSDSTRTLQLATLVDGAFNKLAETAGVDGGSIAKYELTVDAAGTYYIGSTNSGINVYYIAVEEIEAPAHVNSLVVGDTNKIVVTGNTLNSANAPIEWVEFVVTEKAHYEFTGDTYAFIYNKMDLADFAACVCGFSGKADLEPGTYYICVGGVTTGEFNITVTKTAIDSGDDPVVPPVVEDPALALGENAVTIDGSTLNLTNTAVAWYTFTPAETGTYRFSCPDLTVYILTSKDMADPSAYVSATNEANLEAGTKYYILIGKGGITGDFTLTVENIVHEHNFVNGMCSCGEEDPNYVPPVIDPDHVNTLVVGETNKIVVDGDTLNSANAPIEWVEFVVTEKARYEFTGDTYAFIYNKMDIADLAACVCGFSGKAVLEPGTYYICIGGVSIGEFNITVTKIDLDPDHQHNFVEGKCECGEKDPTYVPVLPKLQLGDNTVTIDGDTTNLIGNAIEWLELVIETAGKYKVSSADLNCYIYAEPNFDNNLCGATGVAELQPGTYYVCVGREGVKGTFTVTVETGDVKTPAVNTVVLGENKYVLNDLRLALGYEFTTFVAEKAGYYTFSGMDPITLFIWPDYPDVAVTLIPQTAPYVWNVKADNSGFNESFTVYLEAGEYAIGFRYDFAEVGEYDYTITYSETDPNAAPELNVFQKILATITEFFAKISVWFQNLFAGFKK